MNLIISSAIRQKLLKKQPPVTEDDVMQCFSNRDGRFLEDDREEHRTDPPTKWFISETDYAVKLKVIFIFRQEKGVFIRSAYSPNSDEIRIYEKYGKEGQL